MIFDHFREALKLWKSWKTIKFSKNVLLYASFLQNQIWDGNISSSVQKRSLENAKMCKNDILQFRGSWNYLGIYWKKIKFYTVAPLKACFLQGNIWDDNIWSSVQKIYNPVHTIRKFYEVGIWYKNVITYDFPYELPNNITEPLRSWNIRQY